MKAAKRPVLTILSVLMFAISVVMPASAQVIYGAPVSGPNGAVTGLFQASGGTVTPIQTGLPTNELAAVSPDGRLITISSADPAQPNEASTDLFAFDRVTGQTRRLVNNVTQENPPDSGNFLFASPLFSATSADGQLVAFVNQLSSNNNQLQGGSIRSLNVIRASDGVLQATAEIGHGNQTDFFQSEFVGISWSRSDHTFVAPAYVTVPVTGSPTGRQTVAAGLVEFGPGSVGTYERKRTITAPNVYEQYGVSLVTETHALPAYSPSGAKIAFFRITYPDPLLQSPASTELIVIDSSGATGQIIASWNPGVFPMGVAWSRDGNTLVYSLANQKFEQNLWVPLGDPNTAQIFSISSTGGPQGSIPSVTGGYFPNVAAGLPVIFSSGGFESP